MAQIKVSCSQCDAGYRVEENLLGKKARCKKCGTTFILTQSDSGSLPSQSANLASQPDNRSQDAGRFTTEENVPAIWQPGDVILDRYEVKEVHEGGGMGLVYRVHHREWNVDLAVKSPRPKFFATDKHKQNFERECETWVNLGLHPHIVSCYYVRRLGGIPRVFAEYIDGGSLKDWIQSGRLYEGGPKQALERILDVAIQFAWGLHYAHEQGLVHQDVKPANVMMTQEGIVKVTDFGLAKAKAMTEEGHESHSTKSILVSTGGMTPAYCSPEQVNRQKLTPKTDIWNWAVSVLEMFTGDVTWPHGSVAGEALEAYAEMGTGDKRLPRTPIGLVELLRHCFRKQADERPKSMADITATLSQVYQNVTSQVYPRQNPKPPEALADSLNNRAVSFLDLGKPDEVERLWEQALQVDPHHLETTYNLGLVRWRSGQTDDMEPVRQLEAIRDTNPDNWLTRCYLAHLHLERGDCEAVIRDIEEMPGEAIAGDYRTLLEFARERLLHSRRCLHTFQGHTGQVVSLSLNGDSRIALSGGNGHKSEVNVWDTSTGRCIRSLDRDRFSIDSIALSKDGHQALIVSNNTFEVWKVSTGCCLRTFCRKGFRTTCVVLSPDARHVLCGNADCTLELWDLSTGSCILTFKGHKSDIWSVALSEDGRYALSGSEGKTIRYWEVSSGRCIRAIKGHSGVVSSVAITRDGLHGLSGSYDGTLKLWELSSSRCLRTCRAASGVSSVSISKEGRYVVSGHLGPTLNLRLWDLHTGQCLRTYEGHTDSVSSVVFGPDSQWILSASDDTTLKMWKLDWRVSRSAPIMLSKIQSIKEVDSTRSIHEHALEEASKAMLRNNPADAVRHIRLARSQRGFERSAKSISLWASLYLLRPRRTLAGTWKERDIQGNNKEIWQVTFSPDNRHCLFSGNSTSFDIWETSSGMHRGAFEGHTSQVLSVSFSSDGQLVLSGSWDKTVKLWETATCRCLRTFKGHTDSVEAVSLSPDDQWILSGSKDGNIRFWDMSTGRCLRTVQQQVSKLELVGFDSSGQRVYSSAVTYQNGRSVTTVRILEVSTGRCIGGFNADGARCVALSSDLRHALVGKWNGNIELCEVQSGHCLRVFLGHSGRVHRVQFCPDERWVISSGQDDRTGKLWEIATGRCVRTFHADAESLQLMSVSPDSRWILSRIGDTTLTLWFLDWDLESRSFVDWDEGARPWMEVFLSAHMPYAGRLPTDRQPSETEITLALTRRGKPSWTEKHFQQLLYTLGCAGYGWLRPEGVRRELEKMAANWKGPPPLMGE